MVEPRAYPPFHIDAAAEALETIGPRITSLASVLNGYRPDEAGPRADLVWLRDEAGNVWSIGVTQRDLEFKFEVFSLSIETNAALQARIETAHPISVPDDAPIWLRAAAAAPRAAPTPPKSFERFPFEVFQTAVLRRAEFTVGDVDVGPTFGENPNSQSAAVPTSVPIGAEAYCVVSVALLFTGSKGERLLIGNDWLPFNLIVTQHPGMIDDYVSACEAVDVREYAQLLRDQG